MKRIAKKDEKELYVAYKLGVEYHENTIIYSTPKLIKGLVIDSMGSTTYEDFGKTLQYEKRVILEYNEDTKYIDIYSNVWLDKEPLEDGSNANYDIVYKGEVIDGIFPIYLKSISNDTSRLYVSYNNVNVIAIDVDFDYEKLIATIRNDMYLPIDENTKVWLQMPDSVNDNVHRITLSKKQEKGNSIILEFKHYE